MLGSGRGRGERERERERGWERLCSWWCEQEEGCEEGKNNEQKNQVKKRKETILLLHFQAPPPFPQTGEMP